MTRGDDGHCGEAKKEVVWGGERKGFEKFCHGTCEVVMGDVKVAFKSFILGSTMQ